MSHFYEICPKCKKITGGCRCPSLDREKRLGKLCSICAKEIQDAEIEKCLKEIEYFI